MSFYILLYEDIHVIVHGSEFGFHCLKILQRNIKRLILSILIQSSAICTNGQCMAKYIKYKHGGSWSGGSVVKSTCSSERTKAGSQHLHGVSLHNSSLRGTQHHPLSCPVTRHTHGAYMYIQAKHSYRKYKVIETI